MATTQPDCTPMVRAFFDAATSTISYVVYDQPGGHAAVIDPVLDYDARSGRTTTLGAAQVLAFLKETGLTLDWILETHAHADHLSAAHWLREQAGGRIAIGEHIREVQRIFCAIFNLEPTFRSDGSQFDYLFREDEAFQIGTLTAHARFVPGHTPADIAYQIGDAVFVGDTLFMPDVGTARCDFPGGNAATLYRSIRRLLALPGDTRLFMCHDYPPNGRAVGWQCSVAEQRARNIHVHDGIDEAGFVAMREARDKTLDMPTLILPSIQVNIRAGEAPPAEDNGKRYLKIPFNSL
ncbi:MAG: MBL fold metallo-hydrolase [Burkholderiales bacterium]|nr:MBL fold metallo-hydrolase [Burkholderiales bacterium]